MNDIKISKCIFLLVLIASVLSDNCKISWMETGHEVAESQYAIQLSIVNTTGDLNTYFPTTDYDSKFKNIFFFSLNNFLDVS